MRVQLLLFVNTTYRSMVAALEARIGAALSPKRSSCAPREGSGHWRSSAKPRRGISSSFRPRPPRGIILLAGPSVPRVTSRTGRRTMQCPSPVEKWERQSRSDLGPPTTPDYRRRRRARWTLANLCSLCPSAPRQTSRGTAASRTGCRPSRARPWSSSPRSSCAAGARQRRITRANFGGQCVLHVARSMLAPILEKAMRASRRRKADRRRQERHRPKFRRERSTVPGVDDATTVPSSFSDADDALDWPNLPPSRRHVDDIK
jgi:hypothetical protein